MCLQVGALGRGAFGTVTLVKWNDTYAALKQISKAQVVKSQLVGHIKAEKRLQARLLALWVLSASSPCMYGR